MIQKFVCIFVQVIIQLDFVYAVTNQIRINPLSMHAHGNCDSDCNYDYQCVIWKCNHKKPMDVIELFWFAAFVPKCTCT